MTARLRIVFMGTPAFAVPAFAALADAHDVVCVYTQPPRPAGRGYAVQKSPVHEAADARAIPVRTPRSFRLKDDGGKDAQDEFAGLAADVAVVAAYGLILPRAVLEAPRYGCINIHASLLPRWRGASPIQHAIWKGDEQSGVTIMQMEAGLDTGPMLRKGAVPITGETTTPALHDALAVMGEKLILETLADIDDLSPEIQDDAHTTYAPMLDKKMGHIDWTQSAADIDRKIRALNPWPGTYTAAHNRRLKIIAARPAAGSETGSGAPGTLLNRAGIVACGSGALQLLQVQPDGGKPMDAAAAINGNFFKPGDILA